MTLTLYNTLSRDKEEFVPIKPDRVTMSADRRSIPMPISKRPARGRVRCPGPAVASPMAERIFARNITDIDDKINAAAAEQGVNIGEITAKLKRYTWKTWPRLASPRRISTRMRPIISSR